MERSQKTYQCFVITPFGDLNSLHEEQVETAHHIQSVFEKVFRAIESLCRDENIEVNIFKGDHDPRDESLYEKIVDHIYTSDVVVTILYKKNPNVFFEIGLAMGMWLQPIFLHNKAFEMPSDLKFQESALYEDHDLELSVEELKEKPHIQDLSARIIKRIKGDKFRKPPWFPSTITASGHNRLYDRFSKAVSFDKWSRIINDAQEEIILASTQLYKFYDRKMFYYDEEPDHLIRLNTLLGLKALEGVRITILMMDEKNSSLSHYQKADIDYFENAGKWVEHERHLITEAYNFWSGERTKFLRQLQQLPELDPNGFRIVQMRKRFLPFRATVTENVALVTHRYYTEGVDSGPGVEVYPVREVYDKSLDKPFYDIIRNELAYLISENEIPSHRKFLKNHPEYKGIVKLPNRRRRRAA